MALALYRSYRPRKFSDVVGQDDAAAALRNQVAAGKVSHAYLFTGIRGTGKTSLAKILAKAVNCRNREGGEPCGVCEICTGIDNGSVLDVTEIDAASNNGVDSIRDLRDETAYTPAVADKRVYIIDEVHMLSTGAFNALLKIMEEPPEHVIFILATTEIHKVPATVLSRCQTFDLKRIPAAGIAAHLRAVAEKERIRLADDGAELIARLADGAMRDALSILDTCQAMDEIIDAEMVNRFLGISGNAYLFRLAGGIAKGDLAGVLREVTALYADSAGPSGLCTGLLSHFRNLLMVKLGGAEILPDHSREDVSRYEEQAGSFSAERILEALEELKNLAGLLPSAADRRLMLELSLISLMRGGAAAEDLPLRTPESPVRQETSGKRPPPEKEPQENTAGEETPQTGVFREWPRVIEAMKQKNGMLYGFMRDSEAYRTKTHILIDCGETFKEKLRESKEYADAIKEVIAAETGLRLPIGPYSRTDEEAGESGAYPALDGLIQKARERGIPLNIR